MSTALSTYEIEEALRLSTLTDADKALITAAWKAKNTLSFMSESDIQYKIRCHISNEARDMDWTKDSLAMWAQTGLEVLEDYRVDMKGVRTLSDFVAKVEAALVERESEADDEYPVDVTLHASIRKWIAVSPYTVYRFSHFVCEAAADAARDGALEMLARGSREDSAVPRAVEEASKKWMKAWQTNGTVL